MARSDLIKATKHLGRWMSLTDLAGLVVGVDISCWLYCCLAISCATWSASDGDYSSTVRLVMERVEALARVGIVPLLVFDGKPLPGKAEEATARAKARAAARQALLEHLDAGNSREDAVALGHARRMAARTPKLTNALIRCLWQKGYSFVVAPYEADIQVVHLQRTGAIAAGITGDADLQMLGLEVVVYDTPGHRIDFVDGKAWAVRRSDIACASGQPQQDLVDEAKSGEAAAVDGPDCSSSDWETVSSGSESGFSSGDAAVEVGARPRRHPALDLWEKLPFEYWQVVVAIAGSDYTPGVHGMGLVRATEAVLAAAAASAPAEPPLDNIVKAVREHSAFKQCPENSWLTVEALQRAIDCCRHQAVYDPKLGRRVCPAGCEVHDDALSAVVGDISVESDAATDLASGRCCTFTGDKVDIGVRESTVYYGAPVGMPLYVPRLERADLPAVDTPEEAYTDEEASTIMHVLERYGEGNPIPKTMQLRNLAARKIVALQTGDGDAAKAVELVEHLPNLCNMAAPPADLDMATDDDLRAYLGQFQAVRLSRDVNGVSRRMLRPELLDISRGLQSLLNQATYTPRLLFTAMDELIDASSAPHPAMFTSMLPPSLKHLQPPPYQDWVTDRAKLALLVPCVTSTAIDVRWQSRMAEDGDKVDSESTLTRAHKLVEDAGLIPKFRVLRMPKGTRLSCTDAAAPNQGIMWFGYRSMASLRGACKGADEGKQACYWTFVCLAFNTDTRTATDILACVCGCVAGFNDCAHAAALCLVLQSFPQCERLASGEVRPRVTIASTQYAKAWSGEGGTCVLDLTIPARFCPYKTSTRAHDPAVHGTALSAIDIQPSDLVPVGTMMFQHLTTTRLDAASDKFTAFIRHSRAAVTRHHDLQERRAAGQRAKGRGRVAVPRGVRGQLAWDEYAGESEVEEGAGYIHARHDTLSP